MKYWLILLLGVVGTSSVPAEDARSPVTARADFYVATNGSDDWSGRLAIAAQNGADGPFATVDRARRAVRELKAAEPTRNRPITVLVHGGFYPVDRPITFEPADSGSADAPVIYAAYPGEEPLLSGGTLLTGWKHIADNRWQTFLPEVAAGRLTFEQLYVNDRRCPRPQLPKQGYYYIGGELPPTQGNKPDRFVYREGQISGNWHNLTDVEVVVLHWWIADRIRIKQVDPKTRTVTLAGPTLNRTRSTLAPFSWFRVENVREAMTDPGEWYLDRRTGTLTYLARPGEDLNHARVIAPRLAQIIRFQGDPTAGRFVEHITLQRLTIAHSAWTTPANGYTYGQADVAVDAAVEGRGARNCAVEQCVIRETGNYAIDFGEGCTDDRVEGSELFDLGAGGIKVGPNRFFLEPDRRLWSSACTFRDNLIAHGGRIFPAAVGVWVGHAHHVVIDHNTITDFYYSGVSDGWSWEKLPSPAHHNIITNNRISHIGQGVLSDLGGIYTLGEQPGTIIRGNVISDVAHARYGGHGVYLDGGSAEILVENNVVYRTQDVCVNQNWGRDNTVRNNIFAFGREGQLRVGNQERSAGTLLYAHNLFYWSDSTLFFAGKRQLTDRVRFDHNLYWQKDAPAPTWFIPTSAQLEWSTRNADRVVADPLFTDPDNGDFRLKPNSPAEKVGFVPFDYSGAGRTTRLQRTAFLPAVERTFPPAPSWPTLGNNMRWREDFEELAVAEFPAMCAQMDVGGIAMGTTDEVAASGRHSFMVQNAPANPSLQGQARIALRPNFFHGTVTLAFDLRLEPDAQLRFEWSDAPYSYLALTRGPALGVGAGASLTAGGRKLCVLPVGTWVHIEMVSRLGDGRFAIVVTAPGETGSQRFDDLPCDRDFDAVRLMTLVNLSKGLERFFIDNFEVTCAQR
jgi:hypothetical protein